MYRLDTSLTTLPKTHSSTIKRYALLGIKTVNDLLQYFPKRYVDYSVCTDIVSVQPGETVTLKGRVVTAKNRFVRKNLSIQEAVMSDKTGEMTIYWYNRPYLINQLLKPDIILAVAGEAERRGRKIVLSPYEYEFVNDNGTTKHTGKIVPIYPEKLHISSRTTREKIALIFGELDITSLSEWLPQDVVSKFDLMPYNKAISAVHNPTNIDEANRALRRFAFDELFLLHLARQLVRKSWHDQKVVKPLDYDESICQKIDGLIRQLPFELTDSQKNAWQDILHDLKGASPMNRFLQGDVGSGKTVVSAIAGFFVALNKKKTLIMAPTSILANQHFMTLQKIFLKHEIKVQLVTSNTKKKSARNDNISVETDIVVGTHALLSDDSDFKDVGLIVIDEQHRFGVAQRAILKAKSETPHLLTMTATPIPRTLALTIFGDLDMSTLSEVPKGRLPIKTFLAPQAKRASAYDWIRRQITANKCQVFVICPRIQKDEDVKGQGETPESLKNVTDEWKTLQSDIFPDLRVAMIHGKMKPKEKDEVMQRFKDREFDILVSTTVVEVGIDIPNATIILIEGAERYGLAQLHQLRGRVGRGDAQSFCVLFTSDGIPVSGRLDFFAKTLDGMKLAEYDYRMRGAGDIFGTSQHGFGELRVASLFDYDLVSQSQRAVEEFFPRYNPIAYPQISEKLAKFSPYEIAKD
jgi:ATP-dependent DNA helicase RecG